MVNGTRSSRTMNLGTAALNRCAWATTRTPHARLPRRQRRGHQFPRDRRGVRHAAAVGCAPTPRHGGTSRRRVLARWWPRRRLPPRWWWWWTTARSSGRWPPPSEQGPPPANRGPRDAQLGPPGASPARATPACWRRPQRSGLPLDDDAVASRTRLAELVAHFSSPDAMGVGGRIPPPDPAAGTSLAATGIPLGRRVLVHRTAAGQRPKCANPIGANMSFRRATVQAVGGFSTAVGRVGTRRPRLRGDRAVDPRGPPRAGLRILPEAAGGRPSPRRPRARPLVLLPPSVLVGGAQQGAGRRAGRSPQRPVRRAPVRHASSLRDGQRPRRGGTHHGRRAASRAASGTGPPSCPRVCSHAGPELAPRTRCLDSPLVSDTAPNGARDTPHWPPRPDP